MTKSNKRYSLIALTIVLAASFIWVLYAYYSSYIGGAVPQEYTASEDKTTQMQETLNPEVRAVLSELLASVEQLATDEVLVREIQQANEARAAFDGSAYALFDRQWSEAEGSDEIVTAFLLGEGALRLYVFQDSELGFPEIFVTDRFGLNVAGTNRTSDYYQADESWWVDTYSGSAGRAYYGDIEFDESAQMGVIPLYVPVRDPESGETIGVIKAVTDIVGIVSRLQGESV